MALDRYPAVRREIWRYLEGEERGFLEYALPGVSFLESEKGSPPMQKVASFAARTGWMGALEWIRARYRIYPNKLLIAAMECKDFAPAQFALNAGAKNVDDALIAAAGCGNAENMLSMKNRGAICFGPALCEAAAGGHVQAMEAARGFGATSYSTASEHAASTGRNEIIRMLADWNRGIISRAALYFAIESKQLQTAKFLVEEFKEYSRFSRDLFAYAGNTGSREMVEFLCEKFGSYPDVYSHVLRGAARGGHLTLMQWAREMGGAVTDDAIEGAAYMGRIEVLRLIMKWRNGQFPVETMLTSSIGDRKVNLETMKLAKSWGASGFSIAFRDAIDRGSIPSLELLRSWGVCYCRSGFINLVKNHCGVGSVLKDVAKTLVLLKKWGMRDYEAALKWAGCCFDDEADKLVKAGTIDPDLPIVRLLRAWIAERDAK